MSPHLVKLGENVYTVSGSILSPGFHFRPTPSELLCFLRRRNTNHDLHIASLIPEIDVYAYHYLPGELLNYLPSGELQLYFFCPIARKHSNGSKRNRSSKVGNWHLTGKDKTFYEGVQPVGKKKSLVFYEEKNKKTNWMMHEYTLLDVQHSDEKQETDSDKIEYALCKLFAKHESDLKDNLQTGASSGKSECTDSAHRDSILLIPESHIIHRKDSFSRTTDKDGCASPIRGNTDSGTSGVENLLEVSQIDHGVLLKEVETEGDDPSLLQDNDRTLENPICTVDALNQQSDVMSPEDLLDLLPTDQNLGISGSEHHKSCFQDSQPIEMELMDIDLAVGNDISLLRCNSQEWQMHDPTYGHEYECTACELASICTDVELPCHPHFDDATWPSDANIDELRELNGFQIPSGYGTPMGDSCHWTSPLWK